MVPLAEAASPGKLQALEKIGLDSHRRDSVWTDGFSGTEQVGGEIEFMGEAITALRE